MINPLSPLHVSLAGSTVLTSRNQGDFEVASESIEGLFDLDCRVLSRRVLTIDGHRLEHGVVAALAPHRELVRAIHRLPPGDAHGPSLPEDALGATLLRRVGHGLVERIQIDNHSMVLRRFLLRLEVAADFRDTMALRGHHPDPVEAIKATLLGPGPLEPHRVLRIGATFACVDARTHSRATLVRVAAASAPFDVDAHGVSFHVTLEPRGKFVALIVVSTEIDGVARVPDPLAPDGRSREDRDQQAWRARCGRLTSTDRELVRAWRTAAEDLGALRLEGGTVDAFVPQAGAPTYTGLFGRDALTASWQGALLGPELLRGTLPAIAARAGRSDDPFRDEEPGRLIHEARAGPLSVTGLVPQSAYYGTVTTPAMFVVVLSEAWHWTGDRALVEQHLDTALAALRWARERGDLDGDGLIEYRTRSPRGLRNQGWKDSEEGIRHEDGSLANVPIATIEEQAYHLVALERMAELLLVLDDERGAAEMSERVQRLRALIDERFWQEDLGAYAMALDASKRPVRSIGSNAGHALAAGAVPAHRAARVAERLLADDLFSGFGVRTLSTSHPSFNPYAYHLGAVWPVECATFVVGFKRYGLDDQAVRLGSALLDAARCFAAGRLPEVFAGQARTAGASPAIYPNACWPQAWSASAIPFTLQALLGIYPFAALRVLAIVRPRLPTGVDELALEGIRVGAATVSLRFVRTHDDGRCRWNVTGRNGALTVLDAPPPVDVLDRAGPSERVRAWMLRRAPGRTARLVRLALGTAAR